MGRREAEHDGHDWPHRADQEQARFEDGEIDIDPLDKALAQQLVKIKWSMTSKGQIAVETKKEMRARGLPSPDRADAVAYAFAHVDLPTVDVEAHQGESITGDLMQKAW